MKWIDVKQKLPEGTWTNHDRYKHLSEDVLFCNDLDIFIGRWNRYKCQWETDEPSDNNWVDGVTHWMPLPKLPNKQKL